ncbi:acyl-CoA N-acyltransferase [Infundibulicybe gibba]|nr:acyl-CoA N-acyltransferase [Infundibulicybe gibba]
MDDQPFHPYARACYVAFVAGLLLAIVTGWRYSWNRRGIRLGFEEYVRGGVDHDGDLNDVPASYDLRESGQGECICNEIIVGMIGLDYGPTKSSGLLRRMVVAPGYQRRGIGARLFEMAIAHARSHGMASLHLTTSEWHHAGRALYEKYGFRVIGTSNRNPTLRF